MDTEQGERKKYLPSNSQVETASFQCISLHHIVQNPAQFGHLQRFQVYPSICSERKKTLSSKDCSNKTLHLKLEVSPNSSAKLSQSTVGTHPHSQMDWKLLVHPPLTGLTWTHTQWDDTLRLNLLMNFHNQAAKELGPVLISVRARV
jgi:hypothetical protein